MKIEMMMKHDDMIKTNDYFEALIYFCKIIYTNPIIISTMCTKKYIYLNPGNSSHEKCTIQEIIQII